MKRFLMSIVILTVFVTPLSAQQQIESYKGTVKGINEVDCEQGLDEGYICYTYEVYIKSLDQSVTTMTSALEHSSEAFKVGDSVYLTHMQGLEDESTWGITGYARGMSILLWTLVFFLLIFLVGGKKSLGSIFSLILSFVVIYLFLIPRIVESSNILLFGYITVFLILTLGMYLAHGFRKLTTVALLSTLIGVVIVSALSWLLLNVLNINGMGDESAFLLSSQMGGDINIQILFFFSIILGATGVLDDVVIGQVSSMYEIYDTNPKLTISELYRKTMNVGKEHVASMINTLFIVYAGSSLPLVVLMYMSNRDIGTLVSIDMISEEIVSTLAISTSLLLVVPISTYLSALFLKKSNSSQ